MRNIEFQDWLFKTLTTAIRKPLFGITILIVAIGAALAFGILGIGRSGDSFFDVRYWYFSAKAWLSGLNPYDYHTFQSLANNDGLNRIEVFAYPPQGFALGVLLTIFPYPTAKVAWTTLNTIAVILLGIWGVKLLRIREVAAGAEPSKLAPWLIPAIIIGNPATAHVLWTAQTSLIIAVALIAGWQFLDRGNFLLAGLLLGFVTVKPQLSVLIILWLLLERQWRVLLIAGASTLLCSAIPILVNGPFKILPDWLQSMKAYQLEPTKAFGLSYNLNLKSLFKGFGLELPPSSLLFFMVVGIAMTLVLWQLWRRGRLDTNDRLGLLLGLSLLFFFGRDYDMVVLVPVLSALWWHVRNRPVSQWVALGLMAGLFVPHRLMERLEMPLLMYWRIVILLIFVSWLFYCSLNERRKKSHHGGVHPDDLIIETGTLLHK